MSNFAVCSGDTQACRDILVYISLGVRWVQNYTLRGSAAD